MLRGLTKRHPIMRKVGSLITTIKKQVTEIKNKDPFKAGNGLIAAIFY